MCHSLFIRAETEDGRPYPTLPASVEFDSYEALDGKGEMCLCGIDMEDAEGAAARAALLEVLKPFLKAVSWGNIIIEVR